MPVKPSNLTPLGLLIDREGLSIAHVIQRSGISRGRLVYLRTVNGAVPTLPEAKGLAPIFKMTIDQLADELERITAEQAKGGESSAG